MLWMLFGQTFKLCVVYCLDRPTVHLYYIYTTHTVIGRCNNAKKRSQEWKHNLENIKFPFNRFSFRLFVYDWWRFGNVCVGFCVNINQNNHTHPPTHVHSFNVHDNKLSEASVSLSHSPVYHSISPNVRLCEKINLHRFWRHSHIKQQKSLLNLLAHFREWVRYGHDQLEIRIFIIGVWEYLLQNYVWIINGFC